MVDVKDIPKKLALYFLKENVLFPSASIKISVSPGSKNFELIKSKFLAANSESGLTSLIVGVMPFQPLDEPTNEWGMGTAAVLEQVTTHGWPQPTFSAIITGMCRIRVKKMVMEEPYPVGVIDVPPQIYLTWDDCKPEFKQTVEQFRESFVKLVELSAGYDSPHIVRFKKVIGMKPIEQLPDLGMSYAAASFSEKLAVLTETDVAKRFKLVEPMLMRQVRAMEYFHKINSSMRSRFRMATRPETSDLLRLMIKSGLPSAPPSSARFSEAGGEGEESDPLQELHNKLKEAKLPPTAWKVALKELQRLRKMSSHNPEANVTTSYLELMAELPWSKSSPETLDINKARVDLENDHHAMDKLKKRVLEYLAVRQLKNSLRGPILCFVGPPGVGKTSIGRSIAHTLGREFHRISLGGTCNQSDIRGHRRTYIGAMPGRIIQGLKTVGVNNPVMLLDEVDKLRAGVQGDPASALLEVLDPEQNHTFHDHYLNTPFDLSQVMFIATANSVKTIPAALLDRMEVINVEGYTHEEKMHIALRHLIPKQLQQHGLSEIIVSIPEETVMALVTSYTHEAGVRNLERKIGALCRDVAVKVAATSIPVEPVVIDTLMLEDILGPAIFSNSDLWGRLGQPGVAMGLAATAVGGDVLLVEASKMEGDGRLLLTGQLGSVMKESAKLALTWLRTATFRYGLDLDSDFLSHTDVHIHFPAGAISKDGPSAGVAIITVLVSLFSQRAVATDVAMTGEISLKGAVLPVGGVKAKVLAAHRFGIRRIILPELNAKDLLKLPEEVRNDISFILVSHVDEVIQAAFDGGFPLHGEMDDEDAMPRSLSKL